MMKNIIFIGTNTLIIEKFFKCLNSSSEFMLREKRDWQCVDLLVVVKEEEVQPEGLEAEYVQ